MSSYDAGGDTLKSKNGNTSSAVFPFYNKPLMPLYPLYLGQVIRRGEFKPSSGKKHEEYILCFFPDKDCQINDKEEEEDSALSSCAKTKGKVRLGGY
jgi:hypothetical protein